MTNADIAPAESGDQTEEIQSDAAHDGDVRPQVNVDIETTKYPNAVIIKIEILGADADARELVAMAIKMVVLETVRS